MREDSGASLSYWEHKLVKKAAQQAHLQPIAALAHEMKESATSIANGTWFSQIKVQPDLHDEWEEKQFRDRIRAIHSGQRDPVLKH